MIIQKDTGSMMLFIILVTLSLTGGVYTVDGCGGEINKTSDTITFQSNQSENCYWNFTFEASKMLFFNVVKVEMQEDANLTFYNSHNSTSEIVTLTGKHKGLMVIALSKDMYIHLTMGENTTKPTSITIYFDNAGCKMPVSNGHIQQPYFPHSVPGSLTCTYLVSIPDLTSKVTLGFTEFILNKAHLKVYDGDSSKSTQLAEFTTRGSLPWDLISSGRNLYLEFDFSFAEADYFTALYSEVDADCSRMVSVSQPVVLTSPGFPGNYSKNKKCRYVLQTDKGMTLMATISDLELGEGLDFLTLYNGGNRDGALLGQMTSTSVSDETLLLTSCRHLWIGFTSDDIGSGKGFRIIVSPRVNGGIQTQSPVIFPVNQNRSDTGVGVYDHDVLYMLVTAPNTQVSVMFDYIDLLPATVIRCYDGTSPRDNIVGFVRSDLAVIDRPIIGSGNKMLVIASNVRNNSVTDRQKFMFNFTGIAKGAWRNSFSGSDSVDVKLSNNDTRSTWMIYPQEDTDVIALEFNSVRMSTSGNNASITVEQGLRAHLHKLMTIRDKMTSYPVIYIPAQLGARVTFTLGQNNVTNDEIQLFAKATYTTLPACETILMDSKGTFTSPLFPNQYPLNSDCHWKVSPPAGKMVHLWFPQFNVQDGHSVHVQSKKVHKYKEGNTTYTNETRTDLGSYSGDTVPDDIISSDTNVKVFFSSVGGAGVAQGFNAGYEIIDCGGNVTSNATLQTPGYPAPLTNQKTCQWVITVPPGVNETVNIISFKTTLQHYMPGNDTHYNILEIRDGASSVSNVLMPDYSPKNQVYTSKLMLSRYNKLWVRYTYSPGGATADRPGFAFQLKLSIYECARSQQCKNGVCMHKDWKCNGRDDCGDGSDEVHCSCEATAQKITPLALGLGVVGAFCLAMAIACLAPFIYKRCKYPAYRELRDMMVPVPT